MQHKRRRIWIDPFQTFLVARIGMYCIFFQVAVWSLVIIDRSVNNALVGVFGADGTAMCFVVGFIGVVVLSIAAMYDALKFTHRLVGPLYRFRKTIRAITAGEDLELIRLREGDFLHDLKDDFNAMLQALEARGAIVIKDPSLAKAEAEPQPA